MNKKPTYQELEEKISVFEDVLGKKETFDEALQKSEARYKELFNSMPNGFYVTTPEGYVVDANPAYINMLGYNSLDELKSIYIPTDMYVDPAEREALKVDPDIGKQVEHYRLKRKDGKIIWIEDNATYIKNEQGEIILHQGICRDITDRKRAEEINQVLIEISNAVNTTRDLKDLYKSIHQSLSRIIDLTNFHISLYDRKEDSLTFVYWVDTVDTHPDNFKMYNITSSTTQSHTAEVIMTGKPILHTKKDFLKLLRKRGVKPAFKISEIWLGVPLKIKDEVIGAMVAHSFTDPTLYKEQDVDILLSVSNQIAIAIDQKRIESALKESAEHFRLLIEKAPEAILVYDGVLDRFVNANTGAEKLFGCDRKEILESGPQKFYVSEKADPKILKVNFSEYFQDALDAVESKYELSVYSSDSRTLFCQVHLVKLPSKHDRLLRVSFIDLTERLKAEKEKIKAQKIAAEKNKLALVGQVAGKMAHDFNNILSIIMGNTELCLIDCKEPETIKTLNLLLEQALRGKNLTKNLVAFAKDQEPKQEFFSISKKITLVLELLRKDLNGIEIVRKDNVALLELLADPGMIEHGLVNLLQNSIHAVSLVENPRITISTTKREGHLFIGIEDNGCGIPPEHMGKIYEPSFTLKGSKDLTHSYKDGIKGTGYGMANVKKYIEQHNGTISVSSNPKSGTKFVIRIPIIEKQLTPDDKAAIRNQPVHSDKHILLIEDEPALSDIQYRLLSQDPCRHIVDVAENGRTAMELIDKNQYDIISLDYILPGGISGMDIYHYIRKSNRQVPILFISGNIEFIESIKDLFEKDPYITHLSKPCRNIDYINSLNELMSIAEINRTRQQ